MSMAEKYAVEVEDLHRTFKPDVKAVNGINFKVRAGETFGFLGPNGAGKTTTLNILSTLLEPTSGTAKVCGHDVQTEPDRVRSSIGIVFQDPSLDIELTAEENLKFHADFYNMTYEKARERIDFVLKMVGLLEKRNILVKNFSGGMKRRLEIARGLMHSPKVLFLDEPTLGLDPQTRTRIWDHIKSLNEKEKITVILTTHYMDEADKLCNRIAIIDHGEIIANDTPKKLKTKLGGDTITIETANSSKAEECFKKIDWVKNTKKENHEITLTVKNGKSKIPHIVHLCDRNKIAIKSIEMREPTLDDVFLHYTGRRIREEKAENPLHMHMKRRMGVSR